MSNVTGTIRAGGREFEVEAFVAHDPGCWSLPNGDPGWPGSTQVEEITSLLDEEGTDMLPLYEADEGFASRIDDAILSRWSEEDR